MRKTPKSSSTSKARADAIHAEIDRLTSGKGTTAAGKKSGKAGEETPLAPRDFIHRWMAEHDNKRDKK